MNIRGKIRSWRAYGKPQRIEIYIRWSMYSLTVFVPVCMLPLAIMAQTRESSGAVAAVMVVTVLLNVVLSIPLIRAGLAAHLGRRARPTGWLLAGAGAAQLGIWLPLLLGRHSGSGTPFMVFGTEFLLIIWVVAPAITLPSRPLALWVAAMLVLALPPLAIACGGFGAATGVLFGGIFGLLACAVSCRCSVWMVAVAWELDAARETQSRLAVAEERLRFSRDLHDVLGRNLTTMALKSELAVQLARRGRPEAADQMVEVQRIAQESQREVHEVVRGYRTADLQGEVTGARSVLRAAGITCRVDLDPDSAGLPPLAQSVLGWVVREAATNVLRHSEAGQVSVRLRTEGRSAVLELENDGVRADTDREGADGGGSGLAGLRERLAAHGGELTTGRPRPGSFTLRATLPLPRTAAGTPETEFTR